MTYMIVAFRHDKEHSVLYKKCKNLSTVMKYIQSAVDQGATFASLRMIKE